MGKKNNKFWKWIGWALLVMFIIFNIALVFTRNLYFYKALWYNFSNIDDYKIFENNVIKPAPNPEPWPVADNYNEYELTPRLKETLEETETIAFLVIKNDSILIEHYWDGYSDSSYSNSFSMAKSWVSAIIGMLLEEGKIESLSDPVGKYLEEFNKGEKASIRIKDLLRMSSGLDWEEAYQNPLSAVAQGYYGWNLDKTIEELDVEEEPGVYWEYRSGDTQILSFLIEKITGKTLSKNIEERLWHPMGATAPALWSLDQENGDEKAFCCLNSNARDFARLGKLYLHQGEWNGRQLVPKDYVKESLTPVNLIRKEKGDTVNYYGYQWWLFPFYKDKKIFYARGHYGQYVIAIPEDHLIIVRLGREILGRDGDQPTELPVYFDEVFNMIPR